MARDSTNAAEQDDRATERTDLRFDDWPIEDYDDADPAYVGQVESPQGAGPGSVVFFDEDNETLFEAVTDEETERFVPREDSERQLDDSETLGDAIEEFGEKLGWTSLSSFAREHLQDDETRTSDGTRTAGEARSDEEFGPEAGTFTRSNVAPAKDHHEEFTGSYTYRSPDGQVYIVERSFLVTFDDPESPREARVEVLERLLRAEEPAEERREGDAEPMEETTETFTIDLDGSDTPRAPDDRAGSEAARETGTTTDAETPDRRLENAVEQRCKEWHESHGPMV